MGKSRARSKLDGVQGAKLLNNPDPGTHDEIPSTEFIRLDGAIRCPVWEAVPVPHRLPVGCLILGRARNSLPARASALDRFLPVSFQAWRDLSYSLEGFNASQSARVMFPGRQIVPRQPSKQGPGKANGRATVPEKRYRLR